MSVTSASGQDAEANLLVEQGVFLPEGRGRWQIGQLCLTADRLRFLQPRGALFDIPLHWIVEVALEPKRFVVVRKQAMALSFQDPRRRDVGKVWAITPMMGQWLTRLSAVAATQGQGGPAHATPTHAAPASRAGAQHQPLPVITVQEVERLACKLEPMDQDILWYLWFNRHATIQELAALTGASTHMDILFRIRKAINPAAEKSLGRPILVFEESRADSETGQLLAYNWWLAGKVAPAEARPQACVELFDEPGHLTIVAELVGAEEQDIRVSVGDQMVVLWVEDASLSCYEEIELPAPVDVDTLATHFINGVLSINLRKQEGSVP